MANFTSTSGSYTTTLTVTQTSQNTANNTSTLTYSLTLTKNAGSGLWNNNSCPWSITIDGTQVASGTFTYDFRNYSSLTLKSSTTTTVNHNSDGTKTVSVSASVNMNNSDYVSVMQPSGSLTLTTIPRASDVTVSNYSITNTTGSISATITSKANFYHKWRYKVGSGSWSAWTNKGQINNTTSTVTVANTTLLAGMPTATSSTFYIEVQTYSDSGYATLVGTKSASSTISVNTSNIKPSISLGNIAINSSPISGYAVAGYSSVKSTATTTNSSGASSVTNYFTVSHGSLVSSSSTTTSTTVTTNTVPANTSNYTLTIYAYAKDSRGAVSSTVSKSITVYGYQPPTATLNAYRVASSSATTEDGAGTYAYVTFSGAVSSSVNSQNTIQSTTCTYSGSISGTATSGGHYALADTQTVTFTLTVTDKVTSSTASVTIATASYPLDLYDDGNGNVGVGLGTIAPSNAISTPLQIVSPSWATRIMVCDVTDAEVQAQDSTLTSSSADDAWFKALLKAICVKYPSITVTRFMGKLTPNSIRSYDVTIYDTSLVSSGLPQYSFGYYTAMTGNDAPIKEFGTYNYNFFWHNGVTNALYAENATNATSATTATRTNTRYTNMMIISDTGINALTSATYVQWLNDHNSTFQANGTTIVTADARYNGYATVFINKVGENYGRAIILSYYNRIMEAVLNNGTWTYVGILGKEWESIWTGTLQGQDGMTLDVSPYSRLKVWVNLYTVNGCFEIDLTHTASYQQISGYPYNGGTAIAEYTAGGTLEILTSECLVNSNKNWFSHFHCGYQSGGTPTNKDHDTNYFVYKIEAIR